jgi:hypothetical protein
MNSECRLIGVGPLKGGGHPMLEDRVLAEVEDLATLKQVLQWSFSREPHAEFVDVVVQDEFHHDVIVRIEENVFAVFETT